MRILLQMPGRDVDAWRAALAAALPEAEIAVWPEVSTEPDYALVWRPPPELFTRAGAPKAIFNLGAGVDALLGVPTLPPDVPVIRLTDAGMAEQMAEYVTLAVLRAYREMDVYEAQQRDRCWEPRRPLMMSPTPRNRRSQPRSRPSGSLWPAGVAPAKHCKECRASPGPTSCRHFSRWRTCSFARCRPHPRPMGFWIVPRCRNFRGMRTW